MSSNKDASIPTIKVSENGPYVVSNLGLLDNSKGEDLGTKDVMALCRCGASSNKPFCDGTHTKIGFSGENLADGNNNKRQTYTGQHIAIHDNRAICAHAGVCTENLPAVWKIREEPWIDPDGAEVNEIIETIRKCPSGALNYSIAGVEHNDTPGNPKITVAQNGPYVVIGDIGLDVPLSDGASPEHRTLCRCGGSKNKPFCDGTHWDIKFDDG